MKLLTTITIATLVALPIHTTASADHCADGYTHVDSAGGPLCVGDRFLDDSSGVTFQDPAVCEHGWNQGACHTPPDAAEVFEVDPGVGLIYQGAPLRAPTPVAQVITEPATVAPDADVLRLIAGLASMLPV